jgi:hypothetical protein
MGPHPKKVFISHFKISGQRMKNHLETNSYVWIQKDIEIKMKSIIDLKILYHYSRLEAAPTILIVVAETVWNRLPASKVAEDRTSAKAIEIRSANEIKEFFHKSIRNS